MPAITTSRSGALRARLTTSIRLTREARDSLAQAPMPAEKRDRMEANYEEAHSLLDSVTRLLGIDAHAAERHAPRALRNARGFRQRWRA